MCEEEETKGGCQFNEQSRNEVTKQSGYRNRFGEEHNEALAYYITHVKWCSGLRIAVQVVAVWRVDAKFLAILIP